MDSMLINAAAVGDVTLVKELVQDGADTEANNNNGWTPMIWAAFRGHLDVVKYLVENGANKEAKNMDGLNVMMHAAWSGHVEVVQYLVTQGANKEAKAKDGETALMRASGRGHLEVVRYLVEQEANKGSKNNNGETALFKVTEEGHLDVVKYLVEQGADLESKTNNGWTPLIRVAFQGHLDVVKYLVENGANKEAKNMDGLNVMMHAAWSGHVEVVQYLVTQGANKEAKAKDGETALMRASGRGHLEVVRYLVEQEANKGSKNNNGETALFKATEEGHLDVVKYLVEQGADIEVKARDGKTVLMRAAFRGHLDVVQYLVVKGTDSAVFKNDNYSVLNSLLLREDADENKVLPIAKILLENGEHPLRSNNAWNNARSIAEAKGFTQVVSLVNANAAKLPRQSVFRVEPEVENRNWFISVNTVSRMILPLAEGGFGKVYRAKWSHNDVVVKEIEIKTEAEMNRFRREVNLWRGLTHPNIVQLFGANDREPPYFMVSKYASNEILAKYLSSEEAQGRTVVWQKLFQVAAGLSYLHLHDIVHGDLKGNNIVVSNDGTAMLTDFGLSFLETASSYSVQKMKDMLGAMQWRAPEYAMMTVEKPTRKSDVYSLGMCIIEAVIGTIPWGVGLHANVIREILRRNEVKLEKPEGMSDDQWGLVSRMIAYVPENRPDMEDVLSELETFAKTEKRSEEAHQVVSKVQDAHDADVHDAIGDGAAEDQSGTDDTSDQISDASENWSNKEAASTSFEVPSRNSK